MIGHRRIICIGPAFASALLCCRPFPSETEFPTPQEKKTESSWQSRHSFLGSVHTMNETRYFVLNEGESLTLQMIGFKDYDDGSGNDSFDDASDVLNFPISPVTDKISSSGAAGGNGQVSLERRRATGAVSALHGLTVFETAKVSRLLGRLSLR
jgi:hypothetical protein